jgi:hypothetical protein
MAGSEGRPIGRPSSCASPGSRSAAPCLSKGPIGILLPSPPCGGSPLRADSDCSCFANFRNMLRKLVGPLPPSVPECFRPLHEAAANSQHLSRLRIADGGLGRSANWRTLFLCRCRMLVGPHREIRNPSRDRRPLRFGAKSQLRLLRVLTSLRCKTRVSQLRHPRSTSISSAHVPVSDSIKRCNFLHLFIHYDRRKVILTNFSRAFWNIPALLNSPA